MIAPHIAETLRSARAVVAAIERARIQDTAPISRPGIPCNVCHGWGFLPLSDAEIVRRTCEELRVYWETWPEGLEARR